MRDNVLSQVEVLAGSVARWFRIGTLSTLVVIGVAPSLRSPVAAILIAVLGATAFLMTLARSDIIKVCGICLLSMLMVNQLASPLAVPYVEKNALKTLSPKYAMQFDVVSNPNVGIKATRQITTDAMGFRASPPIDYLHKPHDVYRIFAIGASTTEQISLDDEGTWTHLLQERLASAAGMRIEVVNTGLSGLRAAHHLATFRHILPYSPDAVLFLFGINDWNRHIRETMDKWYQWRQVWTAMNFQNTLLGTVTLAKWSRHTPERPKKNTDLGKVRQELGEARARRDDSLNSRPVRHFPGHIRVSNAYSEIVQELMEACHQSKVRCVFVTQPTGYSLAAEESLKKRFWMTPSHEKYTLPLEELIQFADAYNSFLVRSAAANGFPVCDIASQIPPTTEFFDDDCHYSEVGTQRVAKLLSDCFQQQSVPGLQKVPE